MEIISFTNLTVTFSKDSFGVSDRSIEGVAQMSLVNTVSCWAQIRIQWLYSITEADDAWKWWCTAVGHTYCDAVLKVRLKLYS